MPTLSGRTICFGAIIVMIAATARAQSAPLAPTEPTDASSWRIASGYGWVSLRDVARTGRPVDASPVAWRGRGVAVELERAWTGPRRLRRLDVAVSMAGTFEYRAPQGVTARPSADRSRAVAGAYEYRRYLFTDLLMRGLDAGVGVQALGQYSTTARHIADGVAANESGLSTGVGVVAAVRVRRWPKIHGEVAWTNGGRIARLRERHSETPDGRAAHWGGGWLTNLTMSVGIGVTPATTIVLRYVGADDGLFSSHRSAVLSNRSLTAGVAYAK